MKRNLEENWIVNIFVAIPLSYINVQLAKMYRVDQLIINNFSLFSYYYYISHI